MTDKTWILKGSNFEGRNFWWGKCWPKGLPLKSKYSHIPGQPSAWREQRWYFQQLMVSPHIVIERAQLKTDEVACKLWQIEKKASWVRSCSFVQTGFEQKSSSLWFKRVSKSVFFKTRLLCAVEPPAPVLAPVAGLVWLDTEKLLFWKHRRTDFFWIDDTNLQERMTLF